MLYEVITEFGIVTDTADYVAHARVEGSQDNEIFFSFQQYMMSKRDDQKAIQDAFKNAQNEKEKEKARKQIDQLLAERNQRIDKVLSEHPDLFVATFLKATLDITVPDAPKQEDGSIDSTWQYRVITSYSIHYTKLYDMPYY